MTVAAMLLPLAAEHFKLGSVLSLVIPLGVLVVVWIWYTVFLRRGSGEA